MREKKEDERRKEMRADIPSGELHSPHLGVGRGAPFGLSLPGSESGRQMELLRCV